MDFTSHKVHEIVVLELEGRFDAHLAPEVAKWLEHVAQNESSQIVVDMNKVEFIDSSGITALVKGTKRCRQNGGDLYLSSLQQAVRIIFELTRIDRAFSIFPDESTAVQAFGG